MESFRLLNGNREPNSRTTRTIASGMIGATATWEIKTGHVSADGDTTMSKLIVQQSDLALVHYKVKADADSASITAFDGYMTGWVDLPGQPTVLLERQLPSPVLPVEGQIPWFFPNLPLRNGYHVVIEYFSQWNQGPVYKEVEVLGSENIERENRAVDCWIVDTGALGPPGYRGTTWVEKGTGRVIQSVLKGQPGQMEYWGVDTSE